MRCLVIVALLCVAAVAARAPPSSAGSASSSLQPAKSSASTSGSLSGSEASAPASASASASASAASASASNAVPNIPLPVPSSSSSSSSSDEHSESPLPANVDTSQALAAHKALLQAAAQAKQGKGLGANNRKVTVIGNVNIMNHNEEAADKPDYNKLAADQLASAQEARVKLAEASQKARESEEERKSNVPPAVPAPPPSPSPPPAPKEESEPTSASPPSPAAPADTEEDLKARINDGKSFATKKEKVDNVITEASKVPFAGQFKGAYSWTAWIKFTGPASTEPLLGLVHGGLDTQQNPAFFMQGTRFNKEGTLKIVSGTHACDTEWKPVFPRDKWFFVAVTHDADYFKVFHSLGDGVLHKPDESGCPTKPKAAPVEIKNAAVLAAGAKFSAKPAPMEWSDVRRYVRSLSDEEIEKIMKQARHP